MICGLLGEKLGHSYSPQIHSYLGNYEYQIFEKKPEDLESFLKSRDFQGLNVTIPYKKAVIPYCHSLSPQAAALGAVNTIVRNNDGTLIGHNTDYFGFQWMAERLGIAFNGKKVLVLGSGGASNTVCAVMRNLGAQVVVVSRTGNYNYDNIHQHEDCSVIVNATPVGMYPHNGISPVDLSLFPRLEAVMDLIYNPAKTKLLQDAEGRHLKTENGLSMLVAQAIESARLFTGQEIADDKIFTVAKLIQKQMENIVLIGMPGCGKTTLGEQLAHHLGKKWIDTDDEIEKHTGCTVPKLLNAYGEAAFRKIETEILEKYGKESGLIITTGGGCVTVPENYHFLHQNGRIFWIQRDQLATENRPLSQNNSIMELYRKRKPLYEQFADVIVDNNGSVENAVREIINNWEMIG